MLIFQLPQFNIAENSPAANPAKLLRDLSFACNRHDNQSSLVRIVYASTKNCCDLQSITDDQEGAQACANCSIEICPH